MALNYQGKFLSLQNTDEQNKLSCKSQLNYKYIVQVLNTKSFI